ncbi:Uncharacterised protein [Staphylococcus aureus]|nr:hypothetical protein ACH32_06455 [Staphylococcus aureus]EHM61430.1 hypothetical protein SA21202_1757 [Staphylococcus aureus subsp. aureus 21202]VED78560.1 Uncharacterised protein [Staphylococcus aureus]
MHPRNTSQLPLILKFILNLALIGIVIIVLTHTEFRFTVGDSNVFLLNWEIQGLTSYIFSFLILIALISKIILVFIFRRKRTS